MVKPILETAMRGVLPTEILSRKWNTGFDDIYGLGLRRNLRQLEQLVRNEEFDQLGIINPTKLIPVLHQAALGIGDTQATDRLDKTLALAAWFNQIERREEVTHVSVGPIHNAASILNENPDDNTIPRMQRIHAY